MHFLLLVLGLSTAQAQQTARLVAGNPDFGSCLDGDTCSDRFYHFLSHSMVEQGFVFAHHAMDTSAVISRQEGGMVGVQIRTFPFTAPRENLSGKTENTSFSPVLPGITGGWRGRFLGMGRVGAGAFFLPPIPVKGASAMVIGVDGSVGAQVGILHAGGSLDVSWSRAFAPIVASEEQYEDRESFDNPDNLEHYEERCLPDGCLDRFDALTVGAKAGVSVDATSFLAPYVELGLAYVSHTLDVDYDSTTWRMTGLQGSAHAGLTSHFAKRVQLGLGAGLAYRPSAITEYDDDGNAPAGVLFRLDGSASVAF